jgi:3-deoxy-D-manno-octulosonate 8-phosphate phosphatase (KDO 8-P phosphatase)
MGDDLPDLAVIRRVGFGITPANGNTQLVSQALWQTIKAGGNGAVREAAELILEAQGKLKPLLETYQ